MANEGTTKPTYSELEAENLRVRGLLQRQQVRITDWGTRCFGVEHMTNPAIRGLRLLEEAIEFAQAVEVPQEKCATLVEYVYSRPKGTPQQELGGVGVCLNAAASSINESADDLIEREISRCEAKSPEHFAARNQVKLDAGFDATFPQSSSLVSPGAESADIGKLDTADKSGCTICGKPFNRDPEICFDCERAGSAETGGEK